MANIIHYRDFYDIPHLFIVQIGTRTLLADCPFDHALDDYGEWFTVYELPTPFVPEGSGESMIDRAIKKLGTVRASDIVFDESRRQCVDLEVFRPLL